MLGIEYGWEECGSGDEELLRVSDRRASTPWRASEGARAVSMSLRGSGKIGGRWIESAEEDIGGGRRIYDGGDTGRMEDSE